MSYVVLEDVARRSKWPWVELRRVARCRREANSESDRELLSLSAQWGIQARPDDGGRQQASDATIAGYWKVEPDDLVFNPMWAIEGGVAVSGLKGAVSTAYRVYEFDSVIVPRFAHHFLRSSLAIAQYRLLVRGVTTFDRSVTREDFEAMPVPVPSLSEQRAIADYLDAETARIDALIAKKQRLIHLLEERIDASIMEVVGESAVGVPEGKPAIEIRRVLTKLNRRPMVAEVVTAFRNGQVTTRSARGKDGFTVSWTDNAQVQGVQTGDVVVHGLDGFSGAIGDAEADGVCSPVYHVCQPRGGGDPAFYGRLLRLLALEGYLGNFAVSTRERAVDFRNWDLFGRIPIPQVEVRQQRAIGDQIRNLRPLVELVQQSESLAVEHKTALLSAAIGGSRSVGSVRQLTSKSSTS